MKRSHVESEPAEKRKPTLTRRREIVEAGMLILANEGARHFTAERLAAAVGITSGTIFRHFESMDEILDCIVDRIEAIIFEGFPPSGDSALRRLQKFYDARVQAIVEHPEVSRLLTNATLVPPGPNGARRSRLQRFKGRSRRFIMACLSDARAEGLVPENSSAEECTVLILGAIYAIGHVGIGPKSGAGRRQIATRLWTRIEASIRMELD